VIILIIDKLLEISTAQAFTDTSGASEDFIDSLAAGDAYGNELWFVVRVDTAFADGTSLAFELQCDDNTSFTSAKTLAASGTILVAALTADTIVWKVKVPVGVERYIRGYVTVAGTHSAGTLDMFFTPDIPVGW
jgi:Na+-transporting NADH:ubiquinone oxidoreductase subunit NqrD